MINPTIPTPVFVIEPLTNATPIEIAKPSLRARIVTKVATACLAILQTALKVRDGIIHLAERLVTLFKRPKNESVPASPASSLLESPTNKSSKQGSPLATPLSPFDSALGDSPIISIEELLRDLPPLSLDETADATEINESSQSTSSEELKEIDSEEAAFEELKRTLKENNKTCFNNSLVTKTLLVATSLLLGGYLGYSNQENTSTYNKGFSDGWDNCTNTSSKLDQSKI